MSIDELRELVADLVKSQKETDLQLKETDLQLKKTAAQQEKTEKTVEETSQQIKELSKNIGGINNKFGSFAEGMAFASMERLLIDQFGIESFDTRIRRRVKGDEIELDALS